MVGGLMRIASDPSHPRVAVGHCTAESPLEVLAPPTDAVGTSRDFAEKVLAELLDRFGTGTLSTVGVLAPARRDAGSLEICTEADADGMLVCAAESAPDGAASAGVFLTTEGRWADVHHEAAWICSALRALVATAPLELGETTSQDEAAL
jgi:hypothetical protein